MEKESSGQMQVIIIGVLCFLEKMIVVSLRVCPKPALFRGFYVNVTLVP